MIIIIFIKIINIILLLIVKIMWGIKIEMLLKLNFIFNRYQLLYFIEKYMNIASVYSYQLVHSL